MASKTAASASCQAVTGATGRVTQEVGDGEWTTDLAKNGHGPELLIVECYFYAKRVTPDRRGGGPVTNRRCQRRRPTIVTGPHHESRNDQ